MTSVGYGTTPRGNPAFPQRNPATQGPQDLLEALAATVEVLYAKPKETPPDRPVDIDQYTGEEFCVEFVSGAQQGYAGQEITELPTVRVTAGGRPVPGVAVLFQVSQGELDEGGKAIQVLTDAAGVAELTRWRLGDPTLHAVTAECRDANASRLVYVTA